MADIIVRLNPDLCTERVKESIQKAMDLAGNKHSEFLTPEHLLLAVISQDEFMVFCVNMQFDWIGMHAELEAYVDALDKTPDDEEPEMLEQTIGFISLINRIQKEAEDTNDPISVPDVIMEMFENTDLYTSYLLAKYLGEDPDTWFDGLWHSYEEDTVKMLDLDSVEPQAISEQDGNEDLQELTSEEIYSKMMASAGRLIGALSALGGHTGNGQQEQPVAREPWEDYVSCVNETYKNHNPLIGREAELERTIQILCRKDKNNPLHIGESGVGKTALIYGLAAKIEAGDVPEKMSGYRIYSCDLGALVAGTSYHGEMEKRVKEIMEGLKRRGRCILYIDEMHGIMGNGGSGNGGQDLANLLKPYLEDGSIRFIGSTTYQEYNRHIAKDKGIARRFQQIDIQEPSVEDTIKILNGVIGDYEAHHGVRYDEEAIRYAVEKSATLVADRFLPDKAIDIIDEAGAYRQLHPLCNKKGEPMSAGRQKVGKALVGDILAKVCKINAKALTEGNNASLKDLAERISGEIYGQDDAVNKVVHAVKMSKAGLTPADKPLASLLFVGPTGVGKTEVCKVLARQLGIELVRFDMSEYTEKHTVAKLIGSPAGYVGYDDGGLLTDAIRKNPNCVLLLDEIEKAHQDIYNILLQVMDYARLTDNKGNKVDFKNVILIMTSNAGAQFAAQASVGFGDGQTKGEAMMQTVKKTFKPEFLNRLSGTVVFRDMDEPMAMLILNKKLRQLSDMLKARNVTLTLSDDSRNLLMEKGFTRQYGAREMDRVIQNILTPLLMDEILFGSLANGGEARVERDGDRLVLAK